MHRLVVLLVLAALAGACGRSAEQTPAPAQPAAAPAGSDRAAVRAKASAVFGVLPDEASSASNPVTQERITLGRMLYYDPRLSKNQDVACNNCHLLDRFGVDGEPTSTGHKGQHGARNAPSVYNAALHTAQFWDGRAPNVEEQAKGPVLNPVEMAMPSEQAVVAVLQSIPGYAPLFAAAFPGDSDPITYDHMAMAIGAFERRLMTPSRFDAFLEGQDAALSDAEVAGLALFMDVGCITCHNGPPVGGLSFQKLGLVKPYPTQDTGRLQVTHNEADREVFKVPSLRNVAKTAPYFHDGSLATLDAVIPVMAEHQLGRTLTSEQVQQIETFLRSLTGTVDEEYVKRPELPASGPNTPAPDAT
jgi:cytochrome c peroxidase